MHFLLRNLDKYYFYIKIKIILINFFNYKNSLAFNFEVNFEI